MGHFVTFSENTVYKNSSNRQFLIYRLNLFVKYPNLLATIIYKVSETPFLTFVLKLDHKAVQECSLKTADINELALAVLN